MIDQYSIIDAYLYNSNTSHPRKYNPALILYHRTHGAARILIVDGHNSYQTWEFFDYSLSNDIYTMCHPSYFRPILPTVDVGIFGPVQCVYSTRWITQ